MSLKSMRRWNKIQQEQTRHREGLPEEKHEARNDMSHNDTDNDGVVVKQTDRLMEDDKELKQFFQIQIEAMDHSSLLQLEPGENLPKVKLTKET